MEILFISSFFTNSARFIEFDTGNVILFQVKVFGRNIKEITLGKYFIKVTARPSFSSLRVLRRINPVGTRPKMNVFCPFKIGPFAPIKKDVFWTSFRRPENNIRLLFECVSIAIYIHEEDCYLLISRETF